jgi:hypothetical protein
MEQGGVSHLPAPQNLVSPLHFVPQAPQFDGSLFGFTQVRLQQISLDWQAGRQSPPPELPPELLPLPLLDADPLLDPEPPLLAPDPPELLEPLLEPEPDPLPDADPPLAEPEPAPEPPDPLAEPLPDPDPLAPEPLLPPLPPLLPLLLAASTDASSPLPRVSVAPPQ